MANHRPAWTNEKWVPYLKKHPNASNEDIMAVVNAIVNLQQHTLSAVNRIDNSSLSE